MKYSTQKIHKPIYVYILTVLFGPLAGGLMSGLDYRAFKFKEWIQVLILPTLLSVGGLFFIMIYYPNKELPTIVLPIALGYAYQLYQKQLQVKIGLPVNYHSFFYSLGISVLGMFLLLIPLVYLVA